MTQNELENKIKELDSKIQQCLSSIGNVVNKNPESIVNDKALMNQILINSSVVALCQYIAEFMDIDLEYLKNNLNKKE